MHICTQWYDWFHQESLAAESAGAAARRRKPRDRRRPPAPSPPPPTPQRISAEELADALRLHVLTREQMFTMGYPLDAEPNSSKAVMFINRPPPRVRPPPLYTWDVNAPEFVPGVYQSDSGIGSWGSTPRSDSDEEADAVERVCVRCETMFRMTRDGEYLVEESCSYHHSRPVEGRYTCCHNVVGSKGCTTGRYHVWSGTIPGMNGPMDGYVRARSPRGGVYAIDAEMCYTTAGMELASIAVIAADGRVVYKSLVKPNSPVVDYNTRFSGIRPRDLARATKTLRDVQNDILGFVGTDTILIGHSLDNDLRVLKLLHFAVVDTCALYPHPRGLPLRRSLRALAQEQLGRKVQQGSAGHSPLEDARAALDLALRKVHEDRIHRMHIAHHLPLFSVQPYDPLVSAA